MRPRQFAIRRAGFFYSTVDTGGFCIYCGERANCLDHFFPVSAAAALLELGITPDNLFLIPACTECNSFAGSNIFKSVEEKSDFIKTKILSKYSDVLCCPDWSEEELSELSIALRSFVENSLHNKPIIQRRLKWESNLNLENVYTVEVSSGSREYGGSSAETSASKDIITYGGGPLSILDEKRKETKIDKEFRRNLIEDFGRDIGLQIYKELKGRIK